MQHTILFAKEIEHLDNIFQNFTEPNIDESNFLFHIIFKSWRQIIKAKEARHSQHFLSSVQSTIHCGFTVWHDTDFPRQLFKVLVSFYDCSFKYWADLIKVCFLSSPSSLVYIFPVHFPAPSPPPSLPTVIVGILHFSNKKLGKSCEQCVQIPLQ